MVRAMAGFSLLEVLLAMSLGLLLLLGGSRIFIGALHGWQAQQAAARLQEDAYLVLHRLARDIRMAGSFGCLREDAMTFADVAMARVFAQPVGLEVASDGNLRSLTLVSAQAGELGGRHDWTLLTDCLARAQVVAGTASPGPGMFAIPVRQQRYRLDAGQLQLRSGGANAVLVDNVQRFEVRRDDDRIKLGLTLGDPGQRVRAQTYELVVALRNPRP